MDKYKVDDSKKEGRGSLLEWRCVRKKQEIQNTKVERRLMGHDFRFVQRIELAVSAKHACGFEGEEMKLAELLAADCENAWLHAGWEYTMQKWYDWLEEMKKDERRKMEELH